MIIAKSFPEMGEALRSSNKEAPPPVPIHGRMVFELITWQRCERDLKNQRINRPINNAAVQRWMAEMANDRWVGGSGQPIQYGLDGRLFNGQHRYTAAINLKRDFYAWIHYDAPDEAMMVVDVGKKRTGGDVLFIVGKKYTTTLSGAVNAFHAINISGGALGRSSLDNQSMITWLNENSGMEDSVAKCHGCRIASPSIVSALHYIFSIRGASEDADKFVEDLKTGANLPAGDPVLILRNTLDKRKIKERGRLSRADEVSLIIRAWNYRRDGDSASSLKGAHKDENGTLITPPIKK